ncbi:MAG: 3-deoxy-manno-octulosonate cytidylyltransferase [Wenzhouxiangellaceae bacterium]
MIEFDIIIPARLESTRLPGKVLRPIAGRPMLLHVLDRAREAGASRVIVATDSDRIASVARESGADAIMTATTHVSGTSRLSETVQRLGLADERIVVNLQADEPLMPPVCLRQVAELLAVDGTAAITTLCVPIRSKSEWMDPNAVKVVADERGRALYFSRAPIPWQRDGDWPAETARRHLGLYAYRAGVLRGWSALPASRLEQIETLEQLRALEAGLVIRVADAREPVPPGVDTESDLQRVKRVLMNED